MPRPPRNAIVHRIADSREGWAKAVEILEAMAFRGERDRILVLDLSAIRPAGSPIAGMQGRPASGPISLLRAFLNITNQVIEPARMRDRSGPALQPWEQAMLVDHHLSVEVQVGGARRAARMATKSWRDPGVLRFIRSKTEGGLWTANNSVMVDRAFWDRLAAPDSDNDALTTHARRVFEEVTACAYVNGEPGLINADKLEDHRTGTAWEKPAHEDGRDFPQRPLPGRRGRRTARRTLPSFRLRAVSGHHQPLRRNRAACHRRLLRDCRFCPAAGLPGPVRQFCTGHTAGGDRSAVGRAGGGLGPARRALPDPCQPDECAVWRGSRPHQPHRHRADRPA